MREEGEENKERKKEKGYFLFLFKETSPLKTGISKFPDDYPSELSHAARSTLWLEKAQGAAGVVQCLPCTGPSDKAEWTTCRSGSNPDTISMPFNSSFRA